MQVRDLQAAIDDSGSKQQTTEATAKGTRELVMDTRLAETRDRQDLNSLMQAVGQNEKQIDKSGQQVSSMMLDLRVKTKVGLYVFDFACHAPPHPRTRPIWADWVSILRNSENRFLRPQTTSGKRLSYSG